MVISLVDVSYMSEVSDCEVMHDVIVAETGTGLWYCKKLQPRDMLMSEVPFMPALPWMTKRWAQITGTGKSHVNDQLRDAELRELMKISIEELDDRGYSFEDAMPGASANEYLGHKFRCEV